jgi:hypothetical protein
MPSGRAAWLFALGLVWASYLLHLRTGSWDWYFSGDWAYDTGQPSRRLPGFTSCLTSRWWRRRR